jgi:hypothetical protein
MILSGDSFISHFLFRPFPPLFIQKFRRKKKEKVVVVMSGAKN